MLLWNVATAVLFSVGLELLVLGFPFQIVYVRATTVAWFVEEANLLQEVPPIASKLILPG